ncbi:MAG: hypothetical protein ACI9ON_004262 [Limisphaerales bacterium]|jgi:hypothetical protein
MATSRRGTSRESGLGYSINPIVQFETGTSQDTQQYRVNLQGRDRRENGSGRAIDLTRERVRQIQVDALKTMPAVMTEDGFEQDAVIM